MIGGAPISSAPISSEPLYFVEGALEVFSFTLDISKLTLFTLKLIQ